MLKTTYFYEEMGTYGSYPCKFICNDNNIYVVKHNGDNTRNKHLINEYIAFQLAQTINLRVPDYALVQIDQGLFERTHHFRGGRPDGVAFGSKWIDGTIKNLDTQSYYIVGKSDDSISLAKNLLKIIIFDIWLINDDRAYNNPNVIVCENHNNTYLYAIDHAAIFANQSYINLEREKEHCPTREDTLVNHPMFDEVCRYFDSLFKYEIDIIVEQITSVPEPVIKQIIASIPYEWKISATEKALILDFLISRQKMLNDNVYEIINI